MKKDLYLTSYKKLLIIFLIISTVLQPIFPNLTRKAEASTKSYGILIADKYGKYTFYDLMNVTGKAMIEINDAGNIMVPLKKLSRLMPALTYSYNSARKEASVINAVNGRRIVYKKNSIYCYYYSSSHAGSVRKTMVYKMYVSGTYSCVMVHMSALKWVMGTVYGYQYYRTADMRKTGYDTSKYSGLIVYNPYKTVSELPKATVVSGISKTVRVTIPEGYSAAQIFNLLVSKGVCASTDNLYHAMADYNFSYYPLVKEIKTDKNRCFKLEGYLYPDTYEFYRLSSGQDVIGKFLRASEAKITKEDREKAQSLGYSIDEILTVASLVQKEAGKKEDMPLIASVIYNRLKKPMKLQLDASIYYIERYVKPYLDTDINRYNEYYNTYKCAALPAGPICNPGSEAIQAALNPAQTNYYYFYSDADGYYHFSENYCSPVLPGQS